MFINGIKTQRLSVINDAKQTIYFIIYQDLNKIYRIEQIKVDLKYFYEVFNNKFTDMYVKAGLPTEIPQNFITQLMVKQGLIKNKNWILFS